MLLFGSVFLRQPQGIPEDTFGNFGVNYALWFSFPVPEKPNEIPSLDEISRQIDDTIKHMHNLDERLKELLEHNVDCDKHI